MSSTDLSSPLYMFRQRYQLSYSQMGERFNVNKTTARYWESVRVPAERVPEISRATGIPPHALRPDLYAATPTRGPRPRAQEAAAPREREAAEGPIQQHPHPSPERNEAPRPETVQQPDPAS